MSVVTSWKYPSATGTISSSPYDDQNWSNASYIQADDGNYATCAPSTASGYSYIIRGNNYAPSIPSGATIDGVEVELRSIATYAHSGLPYDEDLSHLVYIQLMSDASTFIGTAKTTFSNPDWGLSYNPGWGYDNKTVGTSSDTWGASLTPTIVNAYGFGVGLAIQTNEAGTTNYLGAVRIRIYYHSSETVPIAAGGGPGRGRSITILGGHSETVPIAAGGGPGRGTSTTVLGGYKGEVTLGAGGAAGAGQSLSISEITVWEEGSRERITWTASTDPDGDDITYEAQFSADGTFSSPVTIFDVSDNVTGTYYDWDLPNDLVTADTDTCKIRLRARDEHDAVSDWCVSWAFRVINVPAGYKTVYLGTTFTAGRGRTLSVGGGATVTLSQGAANAGGRTVTVTTGASVAIGIGQANGLGRTVTVQTGATVVLARGAALGLGRALTILGGFKNTVTLAIGASLGRGQTVEAKPLFIVTFGLGGALGRGRTLTALELKVVHFSLQTTLGRGRAVTIEGFTIGPAEIYGEAWIDVVCGVAYLETVTGEVWTDSVRGYGYLETVTGEMWADTVKGAAYLEGNRYRR